MEVSNHFTSKGVWGSRCRSCGREWYGEDRTGQTIQPAPGRDYSIYVCPCGGTTWDSIQPPGARVNAVRVYPYVPKKKRGGLLGRLFGRGK